MRHTTKITLSLILALMIVFSLSACGKSEVNPKPSPEEQQTESEESSQEEQKNEPQEDDDKGLGLVRSYIKESDALAGIIYLGYFEEGLFSESFYDALHEAGYDEAYPFIADIPEERLAKNDGDELYCLIPADENASVTVRAWDESQSTGTEGDILYEQKKGEPLFLMGNISDIMPNLTVDIEGESGSIHNYTPSISLRDGTVSLPEEGITDLTVYMRSFEIYTPNDTLDGFMTYMTQPEEIDEYLVLEMLKEYDVLPDDINIMGFSIEDYAITIDFNDAFADYLGEMGSSGEYITMGSLVNSYLSAFGCDSVTVTVNGEAAATGHNVYEEPMGFFE